MNGRFPRKIETLSPRLVTALCAVTLIAANAYVCWGLFSAEFTERMESIEGSYMSISRWAIDHWGDLTWFPLWFTGMPFHRVYQPGLPLTVAALAKGLAWTPQHAYHFVTALAYCLGPVTLFWLCCRGTGRRGFAFLAGALYSVLSPTCFLVPGIRHDVGGLLLPRRFQVLVHYGEGPHITAMVLLPLVILFLDRAASLRRWGYIPAAVAALAAVTLTNWPGTVATALAVAAYCLSKVGSNPPLRYPSLIGLGAVAYLIVSPWIPPSIVRAVFRNAQQSDDTMLGSHQLLSFGLLAAFLIGLHFLFRRAKAGSWVRFFAYFAVITGSLSMGREWFGWQLLPQPNRFQVEFEMALIGLVAYAAVLAYQRLPRWSQVCALCLLALFCLAQARRDHRYAAGYVRPIDITTTIEYKMAKWFDANMQGHRVFAPGNVSLWMNMFTDVPQVAGCCDQGVPSQEHRIAVYTIYTGQNAGARDAEISLLWLRAYGADAIGVSGPESTEYFKPYWNPRKFDGVLPKMWRDGDNTVYRVPRRSPSLAHVVPRQALVTHAPENGLVVEPLEPLVAALENPEIPPASLRWLNQHEAEIGAQTGSNQVVFLQVTYDPGWRATENGRDLKIMSDSLGMMFIVPSHTGASKIRLVYDGGTEARITPWLRILGVVLLVLWMVLARHKSRRVVPSPPGPG
jgi:hypothetical protein